MKKAAAVGGRKYISSFYLYMNCCHIHCTNFVLVSLVTFKSLEQNSQNKGTYPMRHGNIRQQEPNKKKKIYAEKRMSSLSVCTTFSHDYIVIL